MSFVDLDREIVLDHLHGQVLSDRLELIADVAVVVGSLKLEQDVFERALEHVQWPNHVRFRRLKAKTKKKIF